jgi:hypothetical protein
MSPDEIRHFLITLDPDTGETTVEKFGTDYNAALTAYAEAERVNGINPKLNTVLISADTLATIRTDALELFPRQKHQLQKSSAVIDRPRPAAMT